MRTLYLGITAFICGFCVMGLELLGFRLFGPTFGYSSYVWGSLIGIILAALSVGYVFGGRLADRKPRVSLLFKLIAAAGCYLFVMMLVYREVLDACYMKLGTIAGSMAATSIIYGPPMILLSMVSPFIIRLLTVEQKAGRVAGGIYGVSNLGSIAGTFVTAFLLVWALGSHLTLIVLSSVVLGVGVLGLISRAPRWAGSLVLVVIAPFSFPRQAENQILRKESFYNDIRVIRRKDGRKALSVNRWTSYSVSVGENGNYLTGNSYYDYFNAAALLTEPREILVLGMGAGTSVKQYLHFFPKAHVDAVEIDPEIIRIAKDGRYFGVEEGPRLKVFCEDARPYLRKTKKTYNVIELDMFQGGPDIPFYVTTREFFRLVAGHLSADGLTMMNVLSVSDDPTLLCSIDKTLREAFRTVFAVRVETSSNHVLVALKRNLAVPAGVRNILRGKMVSYGPLRTPINNFMDNIIPFLPDSEVAHVFTDDKADVERVTFRMVDRYLRQIPLSE